MILATPILLLYQLIVTGDRSFGYGHSFGVLCHYYGREAGLELREDIDTVIQVTGCSLSDNKLKGLKVAKTDQMDARHNG